MLRAVALALALIAISPVVDAKPDDEKDKKPKKTDVIDLPEPSSLLLLLGAATAFGGAALLKRRRA